MNIKQKIGQRIRQARITANLNIQQLADKTENLQRRRISYYESGERTPGPLEALQIAKALNVSPAYLLGLTDNEDLEYYSDKTIPIIPLEEVIEYKDHLTGNVFLDLKKYDHVVVEDKISTLVGKQGFAIKLEDNSMAPECHVGDLVIISPEVKATPGKYVLAVIKGQEQPLLRKYRETGKSKAGEIKFQLEATNLDWPTVEITNNRECKILGVMCEHRKYS